MVEGKYATLPVGIEDNTNIEWFPLFKNTFQHLKPSIDRKIKLFNLSHVYCFNSVQNDIYIAIHKLYMAQKIKYYPEDNIFIYVKQNGSKNPILNFEGWLHKIITNHLVRIINKHNSIGFPLNIDDCNIMYEQNIISCLESTEIKDKVKQLDDKSQRIIELFYFDDIPYKEIAEILTQEGIGKFTVSNLRKKKERALDKLRSIY